METSVISSRILEEFSSEKSIPNSAMDEKLGSSSISTVDDNSDSHSSLDDTEEFLAESFLRECGSNGLNYSPQSSYIDGESPVFFKFFTKSEEETSKLSLKTNENIETPEKAEIDEFEAARKAHVRLRQQEFVLEDLKLTSKRFKKDSDISLLGSFFKKLLSWSSTEPTESRSEEKALKSEEESERESSKQENSATNSQSGERVVHLGLIRSSVTKLEYFDRDLRREAQESLFGGRKNVSFLDKVEVLEIPLLRTMSRRVKGRMFYSRSEFVEMIASNLKEIEVEARRKLKKRRKKQFMSN